MYSLCIFNRKFRKKLAFIMQSAATSGHLLSTNHFWAPRQTLELFLTPERCCLFSGQARVGRLADVIENDNFFIKNEESCIKTEELCIKNEELFI